MLNPDCLFCNIAAKKIAGYVVREDDHTIAFLDIMPRSEGHTVVIPKEHAPSIATLSDAEVGPLFLAVKGVTELLGRTLKPDGMTIGINQGGEGQEVYHLHVHVMPRWNNDGGSAIQSVVHAPPHESLKEIREKIIGT